MKQAKKLLALMFIGMSILAVGCGNPSANNNSGAGQPATESPAVEESTTPEATPAASDAATPAADNAATPEASTATAQ